MNRFHAFNRYFLSHSAADYSKGDRVICNLGTTKNPKFFIGTVTMNRQGLVHVILDNEEKVKFKPTSSMAGLIGIAKKTTKRKAEIPESDIDKWIDLGKSNKRENVKPKIENMNRSNITLKGFKEDENYTNRFRYILSKLRIPGLKTYDGEYIYSMSNGRFVKKLPTGQWTDPQYVILNKFNDLEVGVCFNKTSDGAILISVGYSHPENKYINFIAQKRIELDDLDTGIRRLQKEINKTYSESIDRLKSVTKNTEVVSMLEKMHIDTHIRKYLIELTSNLINAGGSKPKSDVAYLRGGRARYRVYIEIEPEDAYEVLKEFNKKSEHKYKVSKVRGNNAVVIDDYIDYLEHS